MLTYLSGGPGYRQRRVDGVSGRGGVDRAARAEWRQRPTASMRGAGGKLSSADKADPCVRQGSLGERQVDSGPAAVRCRRRPGRFLVLSSAQLERGTELVTSPGWWPAGRLCSAVAQIWGLHWSSESASQARLLRSQPKIIQPHQYF